MGRGVAEGDADGFSMSLTAKCHSDIRLNGPKGSIREGLMTLTSSDRQMQATKLPTGAGNQWYNAVRGHDTQIRVQGKGPRNTFL